MSTDGAFNLVASDGKGDDLIIGTGNFNNDAFNLFMNDVMATNYGLLNLVAKNSKGDDLIIGSVTIDYGAFTNYKMSIHTFAHDKNKLYSPLNMREMYNAVDIRHFLKDKSF